MANISNRSRVDEERKKAVISSTPRISVPVVSSKPRITQPVEEPTKRVRRSNPDAQFAAGVSDIGTGTPIFLGYGVAGAQTLYDEVFADGPQDIVDNFTKYSQQGFAGDAIKLGMGARAGVNDYLNIEEPVFGTDQIARGIGGFVPIPGFGSINGASTLGKGLYNTARHTFNLLTPSVRTGPGMAGRALAQTGIGVGLDQGLRSAQGLPTVFSDEAITGEIAPNNVSDPLVEAILADPKISNVSRVTESEQPTGVQISDESRVAQSDGFARRRAADAKSQAEANDGLSIWELAAIIAVGGAGAAKYAQHLASKSANNVGTFGSKAPGPTKVGDFLEVADPTRLITEPKKYVSQFPGLLGEGIVGTGKYLRKEVFDRSHALGDSLRSMGHSAEMIAKQVANSHIDPRGMAENILETGMFGQGTNLSTYSLRELRIEMANLGRDRSEIFNRGMIAQTELASGINSGKGKKFLSSEHNKGSTRSTGDQRKMYDAARSDKEIAKLMDKFGEVFDTHLKYQVIRGVLSKSKAAAIREKFSFEGNKGYMPLYSNNQSQFYKNIAKVVGINSTKGRELHNMSEFLKRGSDGIDTPMNPAEALTQYTVHAVEFANVNAFHRQALQALSNVRFGNVTPNNPMGTVTRTLLGDAGRSRADKFKLGAVRNDSGVSYVGRGLIDEEGKLVSVTTSSISQHKNSRKFTSGSFKDIEGQADKADDIMMIQHDGVGHVFHVPDAGIRAALDINPKLSAGLHFMNHYKTLFTRFTTGNLSLFAPISHAFSVQQIASNTIAKEGLLKGLAVVPNSINGTLDIFATLAAKEISGYLAQRIATNTGIGRLMASNPAMKDGLAGLQKALERRFQQSYAMNAIRRETGNLSSSLQSATFAGNATDFANSMGGNFIKTFGPEELGLAWRMWKTFSTAMHEGPAYGAMLKSVNKSLESGRTLDDQVIRLAVSESKTVAGDMRRIGAGKFARYFNASVPFSAPMLQSWASIGNAFKANKVRFLAGASAIIGVPTVTEMMYAKVLDGVTGPDGKPLTFLDDSGREWTYNDYYWNGYTTQQRANNFIYFNPGKPPWEAIIVPVSPEWGLFRGAVMESVDAVFGLSKIGAIGDVQDAGGIGRHQFLAGLGRVLDIPLPPLFAAVFSALGVDLRIGVNQTSSDDPDNPGPGLSILDAVPLPGGERLSGRAKTKFVAGTTDIDIAAILQDIFGAAGSLYVAAHEAFFAGLNQKANNKGQGGDFGTAITMGLDAFGEGLTGQARYGQPLWGKSVRPNSNDEIAQEVFARKSVLTRLKTDFNVYMGEGIVDVNGRKIEGGTLEPVDDVLNMELSAFASDIEAGVEVFEEQIRDLRSNISSLGNSVIFDSIAERNDKIDAKHLQISQLRAAQLAEYHRYEDIISGILTDRYKREININLATFTHRGQFNKGSLFGELRKSPQTSQ